MSEERLREAATAVLAELDIIRDANPRGGPNVVHIDTHRDFRAALEALSAPDPADLARWLQDTFESQPAITIRSGVEPQVAWRALADELLRRWGR